MAVVGLIYAIKRISRKECHCTKNEKKNRINQTDRQISRQDEELITIADETETWILKHAV